MTEHIFGTAIPVLGVTGEKFTGKTLFLSSICPAETEMIDLETSSATYDIPFKRRVDFYKEMGQKEYSPLDAFKWFYQHINEIPAGEFRVIAVDPISDIELGLADFVATKHNDYGFSSAAKFKAMGGVFWGQVNAYWKKFLGIITSKCEVFAFSTHLRDKYSGESRTGKKEPKGKKVLMELASLYLWMERVRDEEGKYRAEPKATVVKSRVANTTIDKNGELVIQPVLPPVLNPCTVAAIKKYVKKPANFKQLKENEYEKPHEMTEEEKLDKQHEIAEAQARKAEAALQAEELRISSAEKIRRRREEQEKAEQAASVVKDVNEITGNELKDFQPSEPETPEVSTNETKDLGEATPPEITNPFDCTMDDDETITAEQADMLYRQFEGMEFNEAQIGTVLKKTKTESIESLRYGRAKEISMKLRDSLMKKELQAGK